MLLTLGIFGAYRLYRSLYKNRSCHLLLLLFIPPIALFAFLTYNTTIAWAFPLTSYFALTTALIGFTLISLMALWSALTCYLVFQHRKQKQSNLLLK